MPLKVSEIKNFSPEQAMPEKIKKEAEPFFKGEENEAENLLSDALDWFAMQKKEAKVEKKKIVWEKRVPEEFFPPCIKLILGGLRDGRKRSLFTLINFLRMMNWSWDEIEQKLMEWNEKNTPRLPNTIILGQLRWNKMQSKQINPANCGTDTFYKGIGICKPDEICKFIKNPMTYVFKKMSQVRRKNEATDGRKNTKKDAGGQFKCYSCGKQFKTMKSLMMHKNKEHVS
ncbi:hypothetical protein HZA99_06815 [Candidatus Woesearchaeota archaeon]|nr:hypothetical protein [Candidatus Woesearchaeota archaeon]